jgi:hypothetical protein
MNKGQITLRVVHKSTKQPKGCFEAAYYNPEGKCRSKQCGLHITEPEIAYETVDLWAQDRAKEFGLKYIPVSQAHLLSCIETGANRKPYTQAKAVDRKSILGNKKYYKDEIRKQFNTLGFERMKEVFKEGTALLNELERERNKIAQNTGKAKTNMAEAMYNTYKETGVDTSLYCNDEEILIAFNSLKEEGEKLL